MLQGHDTVVLVCCTIEYCNWKGDINVVILFMYSVLAPYLKLRADKCFFLYFYLEGGGGGICQTRNIQIAM